VAGRPKPFPRLGKVGRVQQLDACRPEAFDDNAAVTIERQLGSALGEDIPRKTLLRQPDAAVKHPDHGAALGFEDQHLVVPEVNRAYDLRFPAHVISYSRNAFISKCMDALDASAHHGTNEKFAVDACIECMYV
jgi:hypothetical protein